MADAYARALLRHDLSKEQRKEAKELEDAQGAREDQAMWEKIAGFAGTALGIPFGPAGMFIGKQLGKYGADLVFDAESQYVSGGKFLISESEALNEQLKDYDKSANIGNLVGTVTDLATTFALGGGFEAIKGGESIGSAVTNADYWTKFGGDTMSLFEFFKSGDGTIGDYLNYLKGAKGKTVNAWGDLIKVPK